MIGLYEMIFTNEFIHYKKRFLKLYYVIRQNYLLI